MGTAATDSRSESLTQKLLRNYHAGHSQHLAGALYDDLTVLWPYFEANYPFLLQFPKSAKIVELGSGSGSLVAWLKSKGFTNATGVDISQQEVDRAVARGLPLVCADAEAFLAGLPAGSVDVVIAKAMFEHMTKQQGSEFLLAASRAVEPNLGMVVIDVPNMDWLLSNHERYMDLTHEIGYTRESLGQMLRLFFDEIAIHGSREPARSLAGAVRVRIVKPLLVSAMRFVFRILGEGAANVLFDSRGITATCRRPRHANAGVNTAGETNADGVFYKPVSRP